MRLTVKYLQEQLEQSNLDKNRYYKLWQEVKSELDWKKDTQNMLFRQERNYKDKEIGRLLDIIRILTKDPRLELPNNPPF